VDHWVLGGHSLGGSMAANYLFTHQDQVDGLVLLASYPAESNDLTDYSGAVATISATLDGLSTPGMIEASVKLLPAQTVQTVIIGGNHAYFGWYGDQKGDNAATITRFEQQVIVIQSTVNLLDQIDQ
jgi:pimeloyl-ACP methyl ester carboxylesterase